MADIQTVTGTIKRFVPDWVKIYPDVNTVNLLIKKENFGIMVKPKDEMSISLTFHPDTALHLARVLANEPDMNITVGSTVTAEYTRENGFYLYKIKKLNGKRFNVNEARLYNSAKVTSSSVATSHASVTSVKSASSLSSSANTGIEAGLKSLSALFPSSNSGSKPLESSNVSSSSVSSSLSSKSSFRRSSENISVNSSSSEPYVNQKSVRDDTSSNSYDNYQTHPKARFYRKSPDRSLIVVNKKLNRINKYHSIIEKDDTYKQIKSVYDSLLEKPSEEVNAGMHRIYDLENWRGFTRGLWSHAGVDFNETLNQSVTNTRMNYALQCNIVPGGLDVRKKAKRKPKRKHLTNKNVF